MKKTMISPMGQIINDLTPSFLKIGFSKLDESEDGVVFGDGIRSIEISTNLHDPLEVTIALKSGNGRRSALWVWEKVLDGPAAAARMAEANRFIKENKLDELTIAQMRVDDRVRDYLKNGIMSALDFLSRHFDEVFNPTDELLLKYSETSQATLARLGIKL